MRKIGFLSASPPHDKKTSSGTAYSVYAALNRLGKLYWIPIKTPMYYKYMDYACRVIAYIFHKRVLFDFSYIGARILSRSVEMNKITECDILFAYFGGNTLGYIKTDKPIIYLTDATFPVMVDYYPLFSNLWKWNIKHGSMLEKRSMDNATAIVVSSDWCRDSARIDLHQDGEKIHVFEFGANIADDDIIHRDFVYNSHIDILFLGVDWERKGGDVAVEAARWLNENGIGATLHIVGIRSVPKSITTLPYVNFVGFLNKNNSNDYSRLVSIISTCHTLLLPTRAECSAIVFAESSAYGLPIFTYDTGGISNYIQTGKNGYMLPLEATGKDFGRKIKDCIETGELEYMSNTAVEVYHEKLNWNTWSTKMSNLLDSLCLVP
jgi:glycosyltransferase involved in cell wall biosynthesis